MTEGELTAALDVLVDRCDDDGDWADVLGRAGLALSPHSRRRATPRRIGIVALAAVLLGVVLVATGFARDALSLLGRIDVDFGSSDPAPDVVRWRFEDLAIGAPPGFAPSKIASEARTVGNLRANGKLRTIWVAPTRRGGFCYEIENWGGGCTNPVPPGSSPSPTVRFSVMSGPMARGALPVEGLQGIVVSDEVERLAVEFADGASEDLDFVFVSTPIDAGFFAYTVPPERQSGPGRPRRVVARNGAGEVVASERVPSLVVPIRRWPRPPIQRDPTEPRHRARPSPAPKTPLQRAEAHGVSVTAGANGSVLFDLRDIAAGRRAMLENGLHYACFELLMRGGVPRERGLGFSGVLQPTAGFRFNGLGKPFDGCYLSGYYGHRWPGKLDNHHVVELAFTDAGRRYFEDRAAAYGLALFARSPAMFRLRRHPPPLTVAELRREFGSRIAALPSRDALPPRGMIGYRVDGSNVVLRRVSSSGRRLEIVIGANGGVRSENIRHVTRVE
jgi:hypothetical protein